MAGQQILIIGLGQFGLALGRALTAHGEEVIAADHRESRVQAAAEFAAEAVVLDATDEAELARLRPAARDACVCAIGDDHKEASILVTALLRQLGARRVLARATDALHERILGLVGAHEVVDPERHFGERLAARLAHRDFKEVLPLGEDLVITELEVPAPLRGHLLFDLQLPRRFHLNVLGVRQAGSPRLTLPAPDLTLATGDVLVLAGPPGAALRLVEGT